MKPEPLDLKAVLEETFETLFGDNWRKKRYHSSWHTVAYYTDSDVYAFLLDFANNIMDNIKSACEFWLKYRDKPELLVKEHPEIVKKEIQKKKKVFKFYSEENFIVWGYKDDIEYNEWLFKLAFKDVLGDKNDKK